MKLVTIVRSEEYKEWEKAVRIALIQREITTKQLAEAINLSNTSISPVLCGSRPNKSIIKKISNYLGIDCPC